MTDREQQLNATLDRLADREFGRHELVATNERRAAAINERTLDDALRQGAPAPVEFRCECGDGQCLERVKLSVPDYESIRARPRHFLVLPRHEIPDLEEVVERQAHYLVVRKPSLR
jgi:hypothetical protein